MAPGIAAGGFFLRFRPGCSERVMKAGMEVGANPIILTSEKEFSFSGGRVLDSKNGA